MARVPAASNHLPKVSQPEGEAWTVRELDGRRRALRPIAPSTTSLRCTGRIHTTKLIASAFATVRHQELAGECLRQPARVSTAAGSATGSSAFGRPSATLGGLRSRTDCGRPRVRRRRQPALLADGGASLMGSRVGAAARRWRVRRAAVVRVTTEEVLLASATSADAAAFRAALRSVTTSGGAVKAAAEFR